jgi:subtilisin family serine protease
VCATDANDQLARFSNYGPPVTIAAPGVDILSTMPTYPCTMTRHGLKANYDTLSGTSMACPVVAGAAAALIACQPALTSVGVVQRLQQTADNITGVTGGGWTNKFGYGRLNLDALLADRKRSATTGAIYGQVVDANGVAIAGARVQCGSTSVSTRVDGMFRLAQVKPGSYTVAASQGKKSRRATVSVSVGSDANLTMVL